MNDLSWVWLCALGLALACGIYMGAKRSVKQPSLVPLIQRRRELQEELADLARPEIAAALLKEESARHRLPEWHIEVLSACVLRAQAIKKRHEEREAGRKQLRPR